LPDKSGLLELAFIASTEKAREIEELEIEKPSIASAVWRRRYSIHPNGDLALQLIKVLCWGLYAEVIVCCGWLHLFAAWMRLLS